MKDFSPSVLLAILSEMFGPALWVLLGIAAAVFVAGIVRFVQRRRFARGISSIAVVLSAAAGILAAVVAPAMSNANFANIHGMLDWATLVAIALAASISVFWIMYVGLSRRD
jgi:hypothetical protein